MPTWRRIYYINSRDRATYFPNNSNSNFQVILPDTTPSGPAKFRLFNISIPFTFYNVPSGRNAIVFNEGSGALTATITAGNYTIGSLVSAMKTALDSAGGDTYTCSYDYETGKITIASSGTFSLDHDETTIAPIIGLSQDKSSGASHVMDNHYNLLYGIQFLHLESNVLSSAPTWNTHTNSQTNEILRIMNRWEPQDIIYLELDNYLPLDINLPINAVDFTLRDELGNIVDLNGADMGFTFILEKEY
jgi:hypothetical protein